MLTALLSLTCIEGFLFRPLKNNEELEVDNFNKNKKLNMRYTQRNVVIGEGDITFVAEQENHYTSYQGYIFINRIPLSWQRYVYTYTYIFI